MPCFFFQAEDGIRDLIVTGVQTCALPICTVTSGLRASFINSHSSSGRVAPHGSLNQRKNSYFSSCVLASGLLYSRSEERRVGKESRYRWSPHHLKKKFKALMFLTLMMPAL